MERAMWTAASGMQAQQIQIDTIANNLANVNTNGYKRSSAEFQDTLYQTIVAPGSSASSTAKSPTGIQLGLGTKPTAIKKYFGQGAPRQTENALDLMIQGQGFFKVQRSNGNIAYTRDGAFTPNEDGQLVNAHGDLLDPPITIPQGSQAINISEDGIVSAVDETGQTNELGQIEVANFINRAGLRSLGNNLFEPTDASGDAIEGTPGLDGLGTILSGALESSNVSIVNELVDMIAAQRAYELNSRAIRAADDMLQQVNQIIR